MEYHESTNLLKLVPSIYNCIFLDQHIMINVSHLGLRTEANIQAMARGICSIVLYYGAFP